MENKWKASRGEDYYYIDTDMLIVFCEHAGETDTEEVLESRYKCGNMFPSEKIAQRVCDIVCKVFSGEVNEETIEKARWWETVYEAKEEAVKSYEYYKKKYEELSENPKVKAILSGAEVITVPSEKEIEDQADKICDDEEKSPCDLSRTQTYLELGWGNLYNCCIEMAKWFKSKIIK